MGVSAAETLPAGAKRSAPAVALRDVTITFRLGAGVTYTAVSEATLSVAGGEFVAIVGPTDCGDVAREELPAAWRVPCPRRSREGFPSPWARLVSPHAVILA